MSLFKAGGLILRPSCLEMEASNQGGPKSGPKGRADIVRNQYRVEVLTILSSILAK